MNTARLISQIPLFASLPRSEIEYLAETLHPCEFPEHSLIFRESAQDDRFYIVLEGQVEIIKAFGTEGERLLGVRERGSFIGEMSLFTIDGQHTASVRAHTPVRLLEIKRLDFDALLHRQPMLAYELVRTLTLRLDQSENLTVLELLEKNRQLTKAYQELQAAQAEIIEKEKLEHELEVARRIQSSILPEEPPRHPGLDFGALMIPARAVGGDFYDFIPLEGDSFGIVVGDVSDKGMPAALVMALTYSLIRAEASRSASPSEVLQAVNRHLLAMNLADMFVTILFGVLDFETLEFHYVRAGHPSPLFLNAQGQPMVVGKSLGQAVGLFDDLKLDEQRVTLSPGGIALIFSDGLCEACNILDEEFSTENLPGLLSQYRQESAQDICSRLWNAVTTFCAPLAQQDDFTLVCMKCLG